METIYLCIIIFLFVLAVFDLIVGVSNDAVNFLNSAVGAKAASFKTILFIAGIGWRIPVQWHDGYSPSRNLAARAFLLCRNHVYTARRHADRRSPSGRLQLYGHAHLHDRLTGLRAARRNFRPLPDQSKQ